MLRGSTPLAMTRHAATTVCFSSPLWRARLAGALALCCFSIERCAMTTPLPVLELSRPGLAHNTVLTASPVRHDSFLWSRLLQPCSTHPAMSRYDALPQLPGQLYQRCHPHPSAQLPDRLRFCEAAMIAWSFIFETHTSIWGARKVQGRDSRWRDDDRLGASQAAYG